MCHRPRSKFALSIPPVPDIASSVAVMTTYNPAVLALNDMLRQQLQLSRSFLTMHKNLHENLLSSVQKNHEYTTLEETKEVGH